MGDPRTMSMREIMARAAYEGAGGPFKWETMGGTDPLTLRHAQEEWLRRIDAALDALMTAGNEIVDMGHDGDPVDSWRMMIQAIKDGKEAST